jgi:hypothetical protein
LYVFLISTMPRPYHPPLFDDPKNIC